VKAISFIRICFWEGNEMRRFFPGVCRRPNWLLAGALGLAVYLLFPALKTGYIDDDVFNSLVPGVLQFHHLTFLQFTRRILGEIMVRGRFFPLAYLLTYGVFCSISNLLLYKSFIIATVILNLFLFHRFIRKTTGSDALAALSVLCTVCLVQFRIYHDPILSHNGLTQAVFAFVLLSLLALLKHLETPRPMWLGLSTLAFGSSLLIYEISYPFFLLHIAIVWGRTHDIRKTIKTLLPAALVLGTLAGYLLFLRFASENDQDANYLPNNDLFAYWRTLAKQLFAALPLSYFLGDPSHLFSLKNIHWSALTLIAAFSASFLLSLATLWSLFRSSQSAAPGTQQLPLLGMLLWTLPAVLIALSPKYQHELCRGVGHLPVYIQYFGVGTILAWAILWTRRKLPWPRRLAVPVMIITSGVVAVVATITLDDNRRVAAAISRPWYYERANLESALRAGLARTVPEGSSVIPLTDPFWKVGLGSHFYSEYDRYGSYFFSLNAGKLLKSDSIERSPPPLREEPVYAIKDCCMGKDRGYVFLCRVADAPSGGSGSSRRQGADQVFLFVRDKVARKGSCEPRFWVRGEYLQGNDVERVFSIASEDLPVLCRGDDWRIYAIQTDKRWVDAGSLEAYFESPAVDVRWQDGFYGPEKDEAKNWRWCAKEGSILLCNRSSQPKMVRLAMALGGLESTLCLESKTFRETICIKPEGTLFRKDVRLAPGELCRLKFESAGEPVPAPADPRTMYFRVDGFSLTEESNTSR
jgi:hypothetical protein